LFPYTTLFRSAAEFLVVLRRQNIIEVSGFHFAIGVEHADQKRVGRTVGQTAEPRSHVLARAVPVTGRTVFIKDLSATGGIALELRQRGAVAVDRKSACRERGGETVAEGWV